MTTHPKNVDELLTILKEHNYDEEEIERRVKRFEMNAMLREKKAKEKTKRSEEKKFYRLYLDILKNHGLDSSDVRVYSILHQVFRCEGTRIISLVVFRNRTTNTVSVTMMLKSPKDCTSEIMCKYYAARRALEQKYRKDVLTFQYNPNVPWSSVYAHMALLSFNNIIKNNKKTKELEGTILNKIHSDLFWIMCQDFLNKVICHLSRYYCLAC